MDKAPRPNCIAAAGRMIRRASTTRLLEKAAEIITARGTVSGSRTADIATLTLIRGELQRREFGTLSDNAIVEIVRRSCKPTATAATIR